MLAIRCPELESYYSHSDLLLYSWAQLQLSCRQVWRRNRFARAAATRALGGGSDGEGGGSDDEGGGSDGGEVDGGCASCMNRVGGCVFHNLTQFCV